MKNIIDIEKNILNDMFILYKNNIKIDDELMRCVDEFINYNEERDVEMGYEELKNSLEFYKSKIN